jgi:microcompartment protein CcmL/EutN
MVDTIGFIEMSSIAGGIEVADSMLKTAQIELISAKASCPGKYYIMISGTVSGVESAVRQGETMGKGFLVSSLIIPRLHSQVIKAVNMAYLPEKIASIGVLEFFNVTSTLLAADTAVKASNIELLDIRLGTGIGGKSFVVLTGDTASVISSVEAAADSQKENGMLVNKIVIPNPDRKLIASLL